MRPHPFLIAAACLLTPCLAAAQSSRAAAVALFDEGRQALQQGDLDTACAKFRESDRVDPATGTTFNLANCEEKRGKLATAWTLFGQVVSQLKADDPRLAIANQRLAGLAPRVPRVILSSSGTVALDTRARLDELELANTSLDTPLPLDPGAHRLIARNGDAPPRTIDFTVSEGETTTLMLKPPDREKAGTGGLATSQRSKDDRVLGFQRSHAALAAGGIGAAGLLVGLISGVVGLNAQSIGNGACSAVTQTCTAQGYNANQRAKTMAVVSSVGLIVGLAGAGTATYLYFTGSDRDTQGQSASLGIGGTW